MVRHWKYGFWRLLMLSLFMTSRVFAGTHNGDSLHMAMEEVDPGKDFDYILPSFAHTGVIPFTMAGNLIIIRARADSMEGNFILDTGAPGLVLNLTYFRNYKPSDRVDSEGGGINGITTGASPTMISMLSFGGFDFHKVHAHRVSLGHIENQKGIRILGLLGVGLFRKFEMIIDYERELIHLHRAGKGNQSRLLVKSDSNQFAVPFYFVEGKLIAEARVGNKKLNFIIDTGAETNVLDSRLSGRILEQVSLERRIIILGMGQARKDAWHGSLRNFSLGSMTWDRLGVLVTPLQQMSAVYGRDIDGMLGYEFLAGQKVGFNFITKKMYLWN